MQILNVSGLTEAFMTFSVYVHSKYFIDTIFKLFVALFTQQVIFYYSDDRIRHVSTLYFLF